MKKIGLAVGREHKNLTVEDKLLANRLRESGFDARTLLWDDDFDKTGSDFDAVIVHSCWGYHTKPREFLNWIDALETNGVRIFNSPSVVRWNLDKIYLRELSRRGFKIPPTVWFERGGTGVLSKILAENDWQKAVVKPTVSATAWRTFVVARDSAELLQPEFETLLGAGGAMVQKFIEEIETRGEWSFVFFDKKFSHACLKRAKAGDFRVQNNFGGTVETGIVPPPVLLETAQKIVSVVREDLLYARVDAVETDGELSLMELELIEPLLFLDNNESALHKFAAAVANRLESNRMKKTL